MPIIPNVLEERERELPRAAFCHRLQCIDESKENKIVNWIIWDRENGTFAKESARSSLVRSPRRRVTLISLHASLTLRFQVKWDRLNVIVVPNWVFIPIYLLTWRERHATVKPMPIQFNGNSSTRQHVCEYLLPCFLSAKKKTLANRISQIRNTQTRNIQFNRKDFCLRFIFVRRSKCDCLMSAIMLLQSEDLLGLTAWNGNQRADMFISFCRIFLPFAGRSSIIRSTKIIHLLHVIEFIDLESAYFCIYCNKHLMIYSFEFAVSICGGCCSLSNRKL